MAWQDEIAQKRATERQLKATESFQNGAAKTNDIDSLISQVKEVQLAAMLGASKPSVVLTDQTDLGDKMGELATKVEAAIKSLDSSSADKQQIAELKSLYIGLSQLKKAFTDGNTDLRKGIELLTKAVNGLKVAPVVNVPAPNVTVDAPKFDLKPLQDTIEQYMAPRVETDDTDLDLNDFRAQDIDDSKDVQYIGFLHPNGNWYIIENQVKKNQLRYVFGSKNYAKAFKNAASYEYQLLDEAVNALSA